jgi:O-antigen/teichoic acid export membrane protein
MAEKYSSGNKSPGPAEERSANVKTHVSLALVYRIAAAGLSYLIISLSIRYLDVERFGIWVTLLSILNWITFFDVGLGSSLRNQLAEAIARGERTLGRVLVSSAYGGISAIALLFFLLFACLIPNISWQDVFNTGLVSENELRLLVFTVALLFLVYFILTLCNAIFFAFQKSSFPSLALFIQNLLAAIGIGFLLLFVRKNLIILGVSYTASMALSLGILTLYIFRKHPELTPAISYFRLKTLKGITTIGFRFFLIQISALIIFTTDNLIIAQILGPEEVTPYNVIFRLFSLVTLVNGILLTPLWSAFTDAYVKHDVAWIRMTIRRLNLLMIPVVLVSVLLMFFARDIIAVWIGKPLALSDRLIVLMGVSIILIMWNNIYGNFINGIGEIRLQSVIAVAAGILNIPLSIYLAKYLGMGSSGVILGTIICLGMFSVAIPLQSFQILRRMEKLDPAAAPAISRYEQHSHGEISNLKSS